MRQTLPRVPKDRIAVLIGAKGQTRRDLQAAAGCKTIQIHSDTGDVDVEWGEPGSYDPVKAFKLPDVIKAVGRGMAPRRAIQLLQDDWFFEMVDLRDHVGKRSNQQRRIRARIIGTEGKIRKLIEQHTDTEISIYNSTVVLVGEENGLMIARQAIEMLASGSEHGTVIKFLEKERRRIRLESRSIDYIEEKTDDTPSGEFVDLVPGLAAVAERRNRRLKAHQVDPEDEEAVSKVMDLAEDEVVDWEEE
ncbi:MAG: KH domain-containing protein [Candidatus Poseidoniaceae archaeon]|jgi:ribosomal RNA assembly protein|nr:KH domain-containing protein [Candidatus Poseidoniaceae archaeon]